MSTLIVQNAGYNDAGDADDVHLIDFNPPGDATLSIAQYQLRSNPTGVVALQLRGSAHVDRIEIQQTYDALLDLSNVTFGASWSGSQDLVTVLDTALSNTIMGTTLRDRIVLSGGDDTVYGRAGTDTLVLNYQFQSANFQEVGSGQIDSTGDIAVRFWGIERIDARFGSGSDTVGGLAGSDILRGGGGSDRLLGRDGADRLFGQGGNDRLLGGQGNDLIDGGGGDTMAGGAGNDRFIVNSADDEVVEQSGQGTDTILSTRNISLAGTNVEHGTLLGSGNTSVTGTHGGNRLIGNEGHNTLTGLGGRDDIRLGGDEGTDQVSFTAVAHSTGITRDVVRGFDASSEDQFEFRLTAEQADNTTGSSVVTRTGGRLDSDSFNSDIAAALNGTLTSGGATQLVLWNPDSGDLDRSGHRYLVVDRNNDGSYSAGQDFVVQVVNMAGTLDVSDIVLSYIA